MLATAIPAAAAMAKNSVRPALGAMVVMIRSRGSDVQNKGGRCPIDSAGQSRPARLTTPGFEQEPGTALGLIDPDLDDAGGGDVVVLFGYGMGRAQETQQL